MVLGTNRNHSRIFWCPGEGFPTLPVPPETVCENGKPDFSLRGVVLEGPNLNGWQKPLVAFMSIEAKHGYPCRIYIIEKGALRAWRTIIPGDEVEFEGRAVVIFRRRAPKPLRYRDVVLATRELRLVTSTGDDVERTAVLLARQLDPDFGGRDEPRRRKPSARRP